MSCVRVPLLPFALVSAGMRMSCMYDCSVQACLSLQTCHFYSGSVSDVCSWSPRHKFYACGTATPLHCVYMSSILCGFSHHLTIVLFLCIQGFNYFLCHWLLQSVLKILKFKTDSNIDMQDTQLNNHMEWKLCCYIYHKTCRHICIFKCVQYLCIYYSYYKWKEKNPSVSVFESYVKEVDNREVDL